jgi:hypothetical protein
MHNPRTAAVLIAGLKAGWIVSQRCHSKRFSWVWCLCRFCFPALKPPEPIKLKEAPVALDTALGPDVAKEVRM